MPTMITIPIGQRTKSIQFGAAYSPSLSFNPDKKLLAGCSGVLSGMGITVNTVPNPDQVTVDAGAFIQRGIIVNVASAQIVEAPASPTFPLFLVAENANEVHNSSVQYLFTTTPAADSCIIAAWTAGPMNSPDPAETRISLCGLKEAIDSVASLVIQEERIVAIAAQTIFTLPGAKAYTLGTNKLFVYRNGKKLEPSIDYSEDTPTQFTLNFGALALDIFDIIVFQGAPSITGLALLNLTDVTTNLANAIKDVSLLRAALATAANPLATIADITAAITGIPYVPKLTLAASVKSDVATGIGGANTLVPGTLVAFTPVAVGLVEMKYSCYWSGSHPLPNMVSGLRVDGVDYDLAYDAMNNGSGGDTCYGFAHSGVLVLNLSAAPHTVQLYGRQTTNFSIVAGPTAPVTVSALYKL